MKIAIDLRPLQIGHQYRGIGAYLVNMLRRFPLDDTKHSYIFIRYARSDPLIDYGLKPAVYKEIIVDEIDKARGLSRLVEFFKKWSSPQFKELEAEKPDVFLQADYFLGLPRSRQIKKYLVMYDLIPAVLSDLYLPSWRTILRRPGIGRRHRWKFAVGYWLRRHYYRIGLKTVARADHIFSISHATTKDLEDLLGVPNRKIQTIHLAPSVEKTPERKQNRPDIASTFENPYLLFMGGPDFRRRISDLVDAFNMLNGRGQKFDLVLAGKEFEKARSIPNLEVRSAVQSSSYRKQIHLVGYVSEQEKAWLFEHAFAFVYPTLYEGFGLPVLEAMQQNCPVITYHNSSLPEIAGDAAILLKKPGGKSIHDAVNELASKSSLREKLIEKGEMQVKKFSWDTAAKETFSALTQLK